MLKSFHAPTAPIADLLSNLQDLCNIRETLEIHLQYIPGHVGIAGNEWADKLAKRGASEIPTLQPCSIETAKLQLADQSRSTWRAEYQEANYTSIDWYKQLRGQALPLFAKDPLVTLPRQDQVLICKFRLGRFPTQLYKYIFHWHGRSHQPILSLWRRGDRSTRPP